MIKKKIKSSPKLKQVMRENSSASYIEQFAPNKETSMKAPKRFGSELYSKIFGNKKKLIYVLAVIAVIGFVIFGTRSYFVLRNTQKELAAIKNDPNAKSEEEARAIVEQVGKLVILPEGEVPTVATVTDPAKLSDQPFFVNSKSGDKVLIYQESRRAILYRPSENKVIEIAPLNTDGVSSGGVAGEDIINPQGESSTIKNSNINTNTSTSSKNTNSSSGDISNKNSSSSKTDNQ